jgi:hypothetical protein
MAKMQLTVDVVEVVKKVTGLTSLFMFNDKRKTFERRYKMVGIRNLSNKQIAKIQSKLTKRHPTKQFLVNNPDSNDSGSRDGFFNGLTVKVLSNTNCF